MRLTANEANSKLVLWNVLNKLKSCVYIWYMYYVHISKGRGLPNLRVCLCSNKWMYVVMYINHFSSSIYTNIHVHIPRIHLCGIDSTWQFWLAAIWKLCECYCLHMLKFACVHMRMEMHMHMVLCIHALVTYNYVYQSVECVFTYTKLSLFFNLFCFASVWVFLFIFSSCHIYIYIYIYEYTLVWCFRYF